MNNWKIILTKDIKNKLIYANREYQEFKINGCMIHLQQAGNKLFSTVENYFMLKYDKRVVSYQQVRKLISNNINDRKLLQDSFHLHKFYYNATLHIDIIDAEELYLSVFKRIKQRVDRL